MKLTEHSQEVISAETPYQKFTDLQTAALSVFKASEVTSMVEFVSLEAGANGFSTEYLLQTAAKACKCCEKDFLMDVLLYNKHRKTKIKTSKGKNKIFAMPMLTSMLMLIAIFPNDPAKQH